MSRRTARQRLAVVAILAGLLPAAAVAVPTRADEPNPAAGVRQVVHRITGLFAPDREADLREVLKQNIPDVELIAVDFDHAEATFAYDPAVAFPDAKQPEQVVERFDQRLREASRGTFGAKPRCAVPREKLTRVEIAVEGLDCKGCALAAYEILAGRDGVEQAAVSFREGRATALIDPAKTTREKLEAALREREVTVKQP